jgi:hypothetical protein
MMGAVGMCARARLRRKVWGTVAVAVLIVVAGGAVLAAVAGARRTDSAYPRLLHRLHASDVNVIPHAYPGVDPADLAKLPQVSHIAPIVGFGIADRAKNGGVSGDFSNYATTSLDGVAYYQADRYDLLEGRLPKPGRSREILVNASLARRLHARIGTKYRADLFNFAELRSAPDITNPTPAQLAQYFTPLDFTVVGIGRAPAELLNNENQSQDAVLLTPAFAREFAGRESFNSIGVDLRDPVRDLAPFEAAVRARYPNVQVEFQARAAAIASFGRAVGPYSDALRLFAIVAALTAALVVGQAALRLVATDGTDDTSLQALGQTRVQRALGTTARTAIAATVGSVGACVLALALSPLFPIGPARPAETQAGVQVDGFVFALGALAVFLVVAVPAAVLAWRQTARRPLDAGASVRPSRVAERLGRAGAGASAVTGVRFALQRDRRTGATSLGGTLIGLVVAIATVGAALTFGASLDRLVTSPQRYGWNWDALVDTYEQNAPQNLIADISHDRDLPSVTIGTRGTVVSQGTTISAFGFRRLRGNALPQALKGRLPTARDEIALGAQTLRDLHRSVGDTIAVTGSDGTVARMRIVGRTVLPSLSLNSSLGLGEGAAVTAGALRKLDPEAQPSFFLVNVRTGVPMATLSRRYDQISSVLGPQRPGDITSYAGVRATPLVLAGLLALLGVGVLVHLLATSIRGRRRDLAILKTIGFGRRQIRLTIAWQATTLVAIALAVGVPIGLVAGRWVWRTFAESLGVGAGVVVPVLVFAAIAGAALVLANAIAAFPARAAARTRAALVLRSE